MRIEVIVWLLANATSFAVGAKDLLSTWRVWRWSRANLNGGEMMSVAKRNVRASLFRFLLATSFVVAGLISVIPTLTNEFIVWFLVSGAVILTLDILMESRYRGNMFSAAQKREAQERGTHHKEKISWHKRR